MYSTNSLEIICIGCAWILFSLFNSCNRVSPMSRRQLTLFVKKRIIVIWLDCSDNVLFNFTNVCKECTRIRVITISYFEI